MKETLYRSQKPTLANLAREVALLRSAIIGIVGRDNEGTYRPEFVEEMLSVARADTPAIEFTNARDFLKRLRRTS
ncbi:MAG: hypothetical protein COV91_02555 [Candidatus Taylorbacteria bacterium CG11_big_fil_rev_8_21_14_0_20_46_11]|uniref:Uncharacterized protein n=1 Tax=Candidatus Taylorbacteria bacterium CG11_big_fil_rev_8_21_14_0_20_46_11 TaxID=1975025 RepID=A0A2H0KBV4_9BACT|nr:MAG: hypothetical protein COV91_02555 [Candidatus Taylorbacteria bacterium CG11_big_fil_rev_8_21_14_0_20_46_11]